MTVSLFSNLFVNGLAMGMVYAMLAIGLILLIRAVGILNFAQGDLLMFGAYLTSSLILDVQVPGWLMVPIAMICFMVVGLVFMFGVYWPLRKASYPAATIIATMGASIILKESVTLIWGSVPRSLPAIITDAESRPGILHLGDVSIQWQYILIVVIGVVIIAAIHLLFEKLYVGKMMQAACQDALRGEPDGRAVHPDHCRHVHDCDGGCRLRRLHGCPYLHGAQYSGNTPAACFLPVWSSAVSAASRAPLSDR